MELDLDAQFMIFEITYHMNAYFRNLFLTFTLTYFSLQDLINVSNGTSFDLSILNVYDPSLFLETT